MGTWWSQHAQQLLDSAIYSALGVVIMLGSFWIIEKVLPFSMRKEIAEDHNTALGIILGAFIIAIAMIVSSAIR